MDKKEPSFNIRVEEFKQNLIDFINNSGLPVAVVYYIFKFVEKDLESTYYGILNSESQTLRVDVNSDGDTQTEVEEA